MTLDPAFDKLAHKIHVGIMQMAWRHELQVAHEPLQSQPEERPLERDDALLVRQVEKMMRPPGLVMRTSSSKPFCGSGKCSSTFEEMATSTLLSGNSIFRASQ